jgi:cysteine synthase
MPFASILDAIGNTPLVHLPRLSPKPGVNLYAKLEGQNPTGSVKDRIARHMILAAEASGALTADKIILEPTSGNTGISLASIASVRGYRMLAVVPNKVPKEKKVLLQLAGAELEVVSDELCPSPGMGDGAIGLAKTYARAQSDRWVMPNQYENEANVDAHLKTTGPEIWRQTEGRVSHVFLSLGTCGTATGLARYFRALGAAVKIVAVQPSEGHDVPGLRNLSQLGVSKLFDRDLIDELIEVDYELAYTRAVELARREGLHAGPSSGLILEGARRTIERERAAGGRGCGVMLFPDNVFKYTSNFVQHVPELGQGLEPGKGGVR